MHTDHSNLWWFSWKNYAFHSIQLWYCIDEEDDVDQDTVLQCHVMHDQDNIIDKAVNDMLKLKGTDRCHVHYDKNGTSIEFELALQPPHIVDHMLVFSID